MKVVIGKLHTQRMETGIGSVISVYADESTIENTTEKSEVLKLSLQRGLLISPALLDKLSRNMTLPEIKNYFKQDLLQI